MTLEQYAYLAEILGVFAVIISLLYVGLEVRQNTKAIKLSTAHNVTEEFRDGYAALAQNGDLAEIYRKGLLDPDSLNSTDRLRFNLALHGLFRAFENAYYQKSEGALDPRVWSSMNHQFVFLKDLPGFQSYWEERQKWYGDDFRTYYREVVLTRRASGPFHVPGQASNSSSQ